MIDFTCIENAQTIAIYRHINPDPDAYGSQFALAMAISELFPDKLIYCGGEQITRLSYMYEDCNMFLTPIISPDLIIIVDTANKERIDSQEIIDFNKVIKIDHHPNDDAYGQENYVDDQSPATAAILLSNLIEQEIKNKIKFSTSVWNKIYLGIVGDTGNFSYGIGLDQQFFTNVGYIFEKIDTKKLLSQLFSKELNEIKFKGLLITKITREDKFAFVDFNSDIVEQHGVTLDFATGLVNVMSEIRGVEIWASFCEDISNQMIRCSLRSRTIDISQLAKTFGGGGHKNASGIRVSSWKEVQQIKAGIKELLK